MNIIALALSVMLSGCEDFAERERATAVVVRLVKADPGRYGPAVYAESQSNESAEVRSRTGRATGHYRAWLADSYCSPVAFWPCLDCCPLTDDCRWETVGHWRCRAGSAPSGYRDGYPCWWGWRRACELYVRQAIRDGMPHAAADAFLQAGKAGEERWIVSHTPANLDGWRTLAVWRGYPR